ncbi:MAG: hypothetical protein QOE68_3300 [Thermoanaerobaculia bacterium]|nr:hypothetical protein [Thermoanaerobaculia bacterium]
MCSVALVPPIVTTTSPLPAACTGTVARIVTALTICTLVAGTPPTVTEDVSAVVKPAPKIVTSVEAAPGAPDGRAVFGVKLMTASAGTVYVNAPAAVAYNASGFVTTTSTASCCDAGPSGVRAVMDVSLTTLTSVAGSAPKVTVAPL